MQPFYAVNKKNSAEQISVLAISGTKVLYFVMREPTRSLKTMSLERLQQDYNFGGMVV